MKFELYHADTCLPDYWRGDSAPHIAVPVDSEIKVYQVKELLRNAIKFGEIQGSEKYAELMRADWVTPENEKLAVQLTRAAYAAVNKLRFISRSNIFNLSFCNDENAPTIYAYFVFKEVEKCA